MAALALQSVLQVEPFRLFPVFGFGCGGVAAQAHSGLLGFFWNAAELGDGFGLWQCQRGVSSGVTAQPPFAELVAHFRTVMALSADLCADINGLLDTASPTDRQSPKEQTKKSCLLREIHNSCLEG